MKIVLVLGAGSSLANAQHFRPSRKAWSHPPLDYTFFEKIQQLEEIDVPNALEAFAEQLPVGSPFDPRAHPSRMEEFFREVFHDFLDRGDSSARVRDAYLQLVDVYAGVIRQTTNWMAADSYRAGPVGQLLAVAAEAAEEVDVITFNHDLVIENEIVKRSRLRQRWCLEHGYGTFSRRRQLLEWPSGTSTFPTHSPHCDHARGFSLHKLHGSLNWIVRIRGREPTHSMLTGQSSGHEVWVSNRRDVPAALRIVSTGRTGRRQTSYTWPVIVPPVYAKQSLIRAFMPSVWGDARAALNDADRILFFGYSLPPIDVEAEKLFQRGIASNKNLPWVGIVDPSPATVGRFADVVPGEQLRRFPSITAFLSQSNPWGG